jgi:hypothetical protein
MSRTLSVKFWPFAFEVSNISSPNCSLLLAPP